MNDILLVTLNARYAHSSLALRYLQANLGALQARSALLELTIDVQSEDAVERILSAKPKIVGFSVYIWNVVETTAIVAQLKRLAPDCIVVLGGPEVSYESLQQPIVALADYVVTGWGEVSFAKLCHALLAAPTGSIEWPKLMPGEQPPLADLQLPYTLYSNEDIAQRTLYVEASRGCPYKCEFCLSALDKTAWAFALPRFLAELEGLYQRGARQFKFIDRTFNLKIDTSLAILEFFLARMRTDDPVFLHFEVVPDHLPDRLKACIERFPPGSLQFEIGIQSLNPSVQALISRRQDNTKALDNLRYLRTQTNAHLHVDLIFGLPGEDLASFGAGFDALYACQPHEIQVGILKRLRGTPIIRHTEDFDLRFNPAPPYNILSTSLVDFATTQAMRRLARYFDVLHNSGRFKQSLAVLLAPAPFARLWQLSAWLHAEFPGTGQLGFETLIARLARFVSACYPELVPAMHAALRADYLSSGARGRVEIFGETVVVRPSVTPAASVTPARQQRHLSAT
jgi:hypothetical protein